MTKQVDMTSILWRCDPSCPRDEWVRIGMAAKAAGIDFESWNAWSSQGSNYKGEKDAAAAWRSFKDGAVGPGTLFYMAEQHGGPIRPASPAAVLPPTSPMHDPGVERLWASLDAAPADHPYLVKKLGFPEGLRVVPMGHAVAEERLWGSLAIPMRDESGALRSLHFIGQGGQKQNLQGSLDGWYALGDIEDAARVYVVEGIGHGWTTHRATGMPVVVTCGSGRIKGVVERILGHKPTVKCVIVADAGKEAEVEEWARSLGCQYALLPPGEGDNFDINDLHVRDGLDAAAKALMDLRAPPTATSRYRLLTSGELRELPTQQARIRGLLPVTGIASIYGASGSGKSFLGLDMAAHIATGKPWFGHRVRQGPVIYAALEGQDGFRLRVRAYERHHGEPLAADFKLLLQPFRLTDDKDVRDLIDAANKVGPQPVIFIDTLNRAAPTSDENTSRDMGQIIEAAMTIREAICGLVVLVHHTGKDASRGLRGHSSLVAALDAAIEVTRDGDMRSWSVAKNKDGADGDGSAFRLHQVELGQDADGEPITSCAVMLDDVAEQVDGVKLPQGKNQQVAMAAIRERLFVSPRGPDGFGPPSIPLDEAIQCVKEGLGGETARRLQRAKEAVKALLSRGLLVHQEGMIWMP